jgi:ABC-type nitrate/sulfonate/bicarbonate transport system substrate-binding protein
MNGTKPKWLGLILTLGLVGAMVGLACSSSAPAEIVEREVEVTIVVEKEVVKVVTEEVTKVVAPIEAVWQVYSWYPPFMPGTVAMVKGFFEDEGIKVSPLESRGGADSIRVLQTTGAAFGTSAVIAAITAIGAGEPLKIVGSSAPRGSAAWQVVRGPNHPLGESPIGSIEEIPVGVKITASRPGSQSEQMAFVNADQAGLGEGEWELIHSGGVSANIALLDEGVIDIGFAPGVPAFAGNVASGHWRILVAWDEIDWWLDSVQVAKDSTISDHPEYIRAYYKGSCTAKNWMIENADSDELVSILMQQTGTDEEGRSAAKFIIDQLMDDSDGRGPQWRWGNFKVDIEHLLSNLQRNIGFGNLDHVPANLLDMIVQDDFVPATC